MNIKPSKKQKAKKAESDQKQEYDHKIETK
jgi:hypothetical protein